MQSIASIPLTGSNVSTSYQLPSTGSQLSSFSQPPYCNQPSGGLSAQSTQYVLNQEVEIYSESSKGWIRGKVEKVAPNGLVTVRYNGNHKSVPVEYQHTHLRRAHPGAMQPPRTTPMSSAAQLLGPPPNFDFFAPSAAQPSYGCSSHDFAPGEAVEYYSVTHGGWIPAKVLSICPNGNYNLDCNKTDVPPQKIRRCEPAPTSLYDNAPPRRVAPSYGEMASPPPDQVGTFQFDLSLLCAENQAPPQPMYPLTDYGNYECDDYDDHDAYNVFAAPCSSNFAGSHLPQHESFLVDLKQICNDAAWNGNG
jgi:hypothetical protein